MIPAHNSKIKYRGSRQTTYTPLKVNFCHDHTLVNILEDCFGELPFWADKLAIDCLEGMEIVYKHIKDLEGQPSNPFTQLIEAIKKSERIEISKDEKTMLILQ